MLGVQERILGAHAPSTAGSVYAPGTVTHCRSEHARAEPLFRRAAVIRAAWMGATHPRTTDARAMVASTLAHLGRSDDSEALYLELLGIRERMLGRDHPETLVLVDNLSVRYFKMERYG